MEKLQNQKGFIIPIIIVVFAIAILGTGGYLVYKQISLPKQIGCTQEAKLCPDGSSVGRTGPNCEFAECPEITPPVVNETAGWKIYTNTEYEFQIKYPSDWSVDQTAGGAYVYCDYQKRNLNPCTGLNGLGIGAPGPGVQIRVDKITLEEFKKDWVVTKQENYLLDGVQAQKIVGSGIISMGPDQNVIFAVKDGYSYVISYTELAPIQNQILSTFKFTNNPPAVGGDKDNTGYECRVMCGGAALPSGEAAYCYSQKTKESCQDANHLCLWILISTPACSNDEP